MIAEQQTAWLDEQQRTWQRLFSLPRAFELACETTVGASPHDVVLTRHTLRLLRYRRTTPASYAEPVLFCYALINRHYILDLQPDKSVVQRYLDRGFDVYMIDWGVPSDADHGLTLRDYVCDFLKEVVDFIVGEHARRDLHLVGYCMGGTISALFTAVHPERIKSLTLMAAPIDFSGRESLLNVWTNPEYFDVDAFIDSQGNCPSIFLQSCFLLMKPVQNMVEKHTAFFDQLDDPRFVANYFAMEYWVNDNIPVAGETFRQFVKSLYQCNELTRGLFHLGSHRVDLGRISCPLLLLTANQDHLVDPASTEGILAHVRSQDVDEMAIDAGHVGLVVGSKAHKGYWPKATQWLADRSTLTLSTREPRHGTAAQVTDSR
jgi:polyhydroxyalkanoate synthase